jgi:hypothetical protein
VASVEHAAILSSMTLRRGDVANTTVPMFMVVPLHEARAPFSGGLQIGNSGRYFAVRNSASAKALSSLTRGRE